MKNLLYIYGAGGLGREVQVLVKSLSQWRVAGFIDDAVPTGTPVGDAFCLGGFERLKGMNRPIYLVIALGDPQAKLKLAHQLSTIDQVVFPSLCDPRAHLLDPSSIELGPGTIVTAGAVITTRVKLGEHVLVNLNVTIGHDVAVGNGCSLMPGVNIAGGISLQSGVLVGSGANLINRITIGAGARIGAGAVVTQSVEAATTVVGVPARVRIK